MTVPLSCYDGAVSLFRQRAIRPPEREFSPRPNSTDRSVVVERSRQFQALLTTSIPVAHALPTGSGQCNSHELRARMKALEAIQVRVVPQRGDVKDGNGQEQEPWGARKQRAPDPGR